jgi:hypothetical protein
VRPRPFLRPGTFAANTRTWRAESIHTDNVVRLPCPPESNAEYVGSATHLPGLVARADTDAIGVLLYRRHFVEAAEIHSMAVPCPGIGEALSA